MNKKFLSAILFGALMVSSTGTFVSCKDYDDDIDELTSRVDGIESQIKDLEAKINAANWITSVTPATGGFTVAFNDGSSYTITNGKDGEAGAAGTEWTISEDGFWVCNGEKTTVKAVGQDGAQGEPGKDAQPEVKKENGKWYLWNGTEFEEFAGATAPAANIPFYYTDPTDPNYNILVIYDENGKEPLEIRLPMAADLGQIVVLGENLDINYHRFNGLHTTNKEGQVKEATWDGSKAMPAKGQYMLTANQDYVYVQVVPSNYDISKLNFKLVNTKGDEAPVVFGTPVPTNDAINNSRAISESGVFAIPYSLKDMTPAEMKTYEKNIKGKALSLVASENVRSIYNYGVELKPANNKNGATFKDRTIPVESIGEPVTIVPEEAGGIYDSYLVMADDEAKADSVRYGISIDGMTFSYKETIKGQAVKFTVRQVTNTAMVVTSAPVTVTFGKEAPETTEIILAEQAHNAVATYTNAAGQKIANQFIIADFAPYFAKVAPTAGDRLVWNDDMANFTNNVKLIWDELNEYGESVKEDGIDVTAKLFKTAILLNANNSNDNGKVNMSNFSKVKIQFSEEYAGITLGNGTLKAVIEMKDKKGNLRQTVEIPFTIAKPTAEEINSHVTWDAQYYSNGVLKVVEQNSITLNTFFKGANATLVTENAAPATGNDKIKIKNGVVTLKDDGKKNTVYTIKNLKISFLGTDTSYAENASEEKTSRTYGIENLKVNFATLKGDDIVIGNVAVMCAGKSVTVYDYRNAASGALTYKLIDFAGDAYTVDNNSTVTITEGNDLIKSAELVKRTVNIGTADNPNNVTRYDIKITTANTMISQSTKVTIKLTFTNVKNSKGETVNVTVPVEITVNAAV